MPSEPHHISTTASRRGLRRCRGLACSHRLTVPLCAERSLAVGRDHRIRRADAEREERIGVGTSFVGFPELRSRSETSDDPQGLGRSRPPWPFGSGRPAMSAPGNSHTHARTPPGQLLIIPWRPGAWQPRNGRVFDVSFNCGRAADFWRHSPHPRCRCIFCPSCAILLSCHHRFGHEKALPGANVGAGLLPDTPPVPPHKGGNHDQESTLHRHQ
jgi:hypothetical protein